MRSLLFLVIEFVHVSFVNYIVTQEIFVANHKSAEKRARQTIVKTTRNKANRSKSRSAEQKVNEAIAKKDIELSKKLLVNAQSILAKVAQTNAISKNAAARKTSRMASKIAKLAN